MIEEDMQIPMEEERAPSILDKFEIFEITNYNYKL